MTKGNITAAAKKLGISRRTLHRKINEMKVGRTKAEAPEPTENKRRPGSPDNTQSRDVVVPD